MTCILVATPCLNAAATLDRTILSVVTQAGPFRIRYHVQDGGSTDGTAERLWWWQKQLAGKTFPIQCGEVAFSFATEPDGGRHDAVCRGFAAGQASGASFLTWLDAGERLVPGALAFVADADLCFTPEQVSWIGSAASVAHPAIPGLSRDDPIPRAALQHGLCDGVHWPRLQRAGSFFRPWLWAKADPEQTLQGLRRAGDWALWRRFAASASLVQAGVALGYAAGDRHRNGPSPAFLSEIDAVLAPDARRAALAALGAAGDPVRRRFARPEDGDDPSIREESCREQFIGRHRAVFGVDPDPAPPAAESRILYRATRPEPPAIRPLADIVSVRGNILAYDDGWQFPAVTERHAFHKLSALGAVPDNVTYIAYPWATLIDKLDRKAGDADLLLERFREFCALVPADTVKLTTCQHIKFKAHRRLFVDCGITEVFWSHATLDDVALGRQDGIALRPFPLYPVQNPAPAGDGSADRPHLFSFIGARANRFYLTEVRNWILDLLRDAPRSQIVGRDTWHYNRVVYDYQVRPQDGGGAEPDRLIDRSASEQFRASLRDSVFSLCPSGTGPNSIRLWESLGAGAIPVILADTYAPPGDPQLWQAAAVFCREAPEDVRTLPARLEEIAGDPRRLEAMRHAGRQIWTLYGPQCFVYDLQKFLLGALEGGGGPDMDDFSDVIGPAFPGTLIRHLSGKRTLSGAEAALLLQSVSGTLLLSGVDALAPCEGDTQAGRLIRKARATLAADHPAARHLDEVCAVLRERDPDLAAPALDTDGRLRICLLGRHSNRTPLGYAPFQRLAADRVAFVTAPSAADIVLTGFNVDLHENAETLADAVRRNPQARVVVLSEEPLWDSIWSNGFAERRRIADPGGIDLPYTFLNHANSTIFDFERIPYFLLTRPDFLARYGLLIGRHTNLGPRALLDHWRQAAIPAAFFAEYRDNAAYDRSFPDQQVFGLSCYRSEVARLVGDPAALRVGKGWGSDTPRQDLPDWHLDKLATLDMQVRIASAYENTHQHAYVSEKIFDAFVVGGIPTYFADPQHRIFDLVPETVMINTHGQDAQAAADRIAGFAPDAGLAEAWLQTARSLQDRFTDLKAIAAERRRVVNEVLHELDICRAEPA